MKLLTSTRLLMGCVVATAVAGTVTSGCSTGVAVAPSGQTTAPASAPATSQTSTETSTQTTTNTRSSSIAWQPTYEKAWEKAYLQKKPIMLDFYADWCGACKHLDANIYTDSNVINASSEFVSVKIDADKRVDLAKKFKVNALPTIVWMDNKGQIIHQIVGVSDVNSFLSDMSTARSKFQPIS